MTLRALLGSGMFKAGRGQQWPQLFELKLSQVLKGNKL